MNGVLLSFILIVVFTLPGNLTAQSTIMSEIAPAGKLRVAMNAGTPVLLMRTADGKTTGGVGVEIGIYRREARSFI